MSYPKNVLYIGYHAPVHGTGSGIILRRHLCRLEAHGCKIHLALPERFCARGIFPESWNLIPIPSRRWWWVPHRDNLSGSQRLRYRYWERELAKGLAGVSPAAIVTILWEAHAGLAAYLSKAWSIPLSVIVHDEEEFWARSEQHAKLIRERSNFVLSQASRIWPVSVEMSSRYGCFGKEKLRLLMPIPEGSSQACVDWNYRGLKPVIAHAGSLHSIQLPNFEKVAAALERMNGTFLIISPKPDAYKNEVIAQLSEKFSNIRAVEPFPTNRGAFNLIQENASGVLVSYAMDTDSHPWGATSFPSRLVEYCHLGIPIIIAAPKGTACYNWCVEKQWLGHVTNMDDEPLCDLIEKTIHKPSWFLMAEQSRKAAQFEFAPDLIQRQFESELVFL